MSIGVVVARPVTGVLVARTGIELLRDRTAVPLRRVRARHRRDRCGHTDAENGGPAGARPPLAWAATVPSCGQSAVQPAPTGDGFCSPSRGLPVLPLPHPAPPTILPVTT